MARSFTSGSSTHIDTGIAGSEFPSYTALTASVWGFPTVSARQTYFGNQDFTANAGFLIETFLGGDSLATVVVGGSGHGFDAGVSPGQNSWRHIVIWWNGSTANMYYNGTAVGAAVSTTGNLGTSSVNVWLGGRSFGPTEFFDGRIADAAIWNVALTPLEISQLANGRRPIRIRPLSLRGWWPLDGLASPEPDLSGLHRNGTLNGTILSAFGPPIDILSRKSPRTDPFGIPPPAPGAQYRMLEDHYIGVQFIPAGTVTTADVNGLLPFGWVPTPNVEPLNSTALTAFYANGPNFRSGLIRAQFVGSPVPAPVTFWKQIGPNLFQLTGLGANLAPKTAF